MGAYIVEESHQVWHDYLAAFVFKQPDDVVVRHRVELYKYLADKSDARLLDVQHREFREVLDDVADVLVEVRQRKRLHVLAQEQPPLFVERVRASLCDLVGTNLVQAA